MLINRADEKEAIHQSTPERIIFSGLIPAKRRGEEAIINSI